MASTSSVQASCAVLTSAVDRIVALPVGQCGPEQLQVGIRAVARERDRLDGWLSAASGQLDASTAGRVPTPDGGDRSVAGWLAEATRTSSGTAGARLRTSTALRDLPLVVQAVLDGVLSQEQAAVLARLVASIPLEHLQAVQAELVEVAAGRDPGQLARYVAHLIATHCEPQVDDETDTARAKRFWKARQDGALVRGGFAIPAEDYETVATVLEPMARKQGSTDDRSAAQRRADSVVDVFDQVLRHGDLPDHGGQRPTISYVLPADWAARQSDRAQCPTCSSCPTHRPASFADTVLASLPGRPGIPAEWACATAAWTGPATRGRVEALLCDSRVSRVLLDDIGQVQGLEALGDAVTPPQRRALAARDGRCTARGCTRPAADCDAHHLVPLAEGGPTAMGNLVLLCRRHHVLWHLGRLALTDLHVPWHPSQNSDPPRE